MQSRWTEVPQLIARGLCWAGILMLAGLPMAAAQTSGWTLVGWNDLGMHCMDADFEVLAILPPYNTVHAQLISPSGELLGTPNGITVTYQAVADPSGSINTSSLGKTGFWNAVAHLFGITVAEDEGLTGSRMPGASNTPQPMHFDPALQWFTAEGVPITPYDDDGNKNPYPLMRLVARDAAGNVLATTDVVLPVSDEMDCRACHSSGGPAAAEPVAGWVWNPNSEHDYRENILRLHDEKQSSNPMWSGLLTASGYDAAGLEATAAGGKPILCAACHPSNALPGTGQDGVSPLTRAVHGGHAGVLDPANGMTLDSSENRTACYRCHPGSETRCLRGAMGAAVAANGELAMQCQSCHGSMLTVGDEARAGWFDEPVCQSCHTGTATHNNGRIRYTDVYVAPGVERDAVDATFATEADTPVAGVSLYRFSTGHGGLQCSACHGSPHAILPTAHGNDNLQNTALQGHAGTLAECAVCHGQSPRTTSGGPHGMHPVGQAWVNDHPDAAGPACRSCHGSDSRGTVLSRALGDRVLSTPYGTKVMWKGFEIGCYACHMGPDSEDRSSNHAPLVADASASTMVDTEIEVALAASDADGDPLTLRVVLQPAHGTAWIVGSTAHYRPESGFSGTDQLSFAARDGMTDSNLGTITIVVGESALIFDDGFESATTSRWSTTVQ